MASADIIAQFGAKLDNMNATLNAKLDAKLDAQSAALEAKFDALTTKLIVLIWEIGFATVILSAAIFLN